MGRRRVALAPDRMTDRALWERSTNLIEACKYVRGQTPTERDWALDELRAVLAELRLRGTQLELVTAG